ncbi:Uncharacterised protein [Raoultella terrigena]|uniref:Uncharacterized protein n=1 Tax=Raoultella terrigena TaxID=577 RepID=A0A4U9D7I6_RAOTE|nr:Uncharacterised protein [Raoultella terrigena]
MSVQNIINITEANLHQTLEQSVTAAGAVLFLVRAPASTASS